MTKRIIFSRAFFLEDTGGYRIFWVLWEQILPTSRRRLIYHTDESMLSRVFGSGCHSRSRQAGGAQLINCEVWNRMHVKSSPPAKSTLEPVFLIKLLLARPVELNFRVLYPQYLDCLFENKKTYDYQRKVLLEKSYNQWWISRSLSILSYWTTYCVARKNSVNFLKTMLS